MSSISIAQLVIEINSHYSEIMTEDENRLEEVLNIRQVMNISSYINKLPEIKYDVGLYRLELRHNT